MSQNKTRTHLTRQMPNIGGTGFAPVRGGEALSSSQAKSQLAFTIKRMSAFAISHICNLQFPISELVVSHFRKLQFRILAIWHFGNLVFWQFDKIQFYQPTKAPAGRISNPKFEPKKRPAGAFWADQLVFSAEKVSRRAFWADQIVF